VQRRRQVYYWRWQQVPQSSFAVDVFCKTITLRASDVMAAAPCQCSDDEFLNRRIPNNEYRSPANEQPPAAAPPTNGSASAAHNHAAYPSAAPRQLNELAKSRSLPAATHANFIQQGSGATNSASYAAPAYWTQTQPVVYYQPTVPLIRQ
jgi:hypothetical protein